MKLYYVCFTFVNFLSQIKIGTLVCFHLENDTECLIKYVYVHHVRTCLGKDARARKLHVICKYTIGKTIIAMLAFLRNEGS